VWLCEVLLPLLKLTDHWLESAAAASGLSVSATVPGDFQAAADSGLPTQTAPSAESEMVHAACLLRLPCYLLDHCCPGEADGAAGKQAFSSQRGTGIQAAAATATPVAPPLAAHAVPASTAAGAADLAVGLGKPQSSKLPKWLRSHSPPSGKHIAEILARFERFVRLVPAVLSGEATTKTRVVDAALNVICSGSI
jgi:hypothetical protein